MSLPASSAPDDEAPAARERSHAWRRGWDRVTALALLLPVLFLAALGLLAGDPQAELSATGWALLLATPLALLLVLRRAAPAPRGLVPLLGFCLAGGVSLLWFPPIDTLERDRAMGLALVCVTAYLGGASLGSAGRAWLARGLVLASLAAALAALAGGAPWAGPLQNSGSSSELILPGALIGAWLCAADRSAPGPLWRVLGAGALLAEAGYAGRAPVLAAVVALTAVLSLGVALTPGRGERLRLLALCTLAAAVLAAGWSARSAAASSGADTAGEQPARPDLARDLGGLEVRRRIWATLPRLALDHPWFGVGPGQFAAAYPPYRDPRERELSDAPLAGRAQSEVEHAHCDWLQGALEVGLPGGALWVLFLAIASARAAAALRGAPVQAALGAGALGVLVNAFLRAPLLWNPAAAAAGFALFGAVLAHDSLRVDEGVRARARLARAVLLAAALGILLQLGAARAIVRHGRALASWPERPDGFRRALEARPDSVAALSLAARAAEPGPPAGAAAAWEAVLRVRPHRREALVQLGNARARADDLDGARRAWRYALGLAPGDAAVLNNLMRAAAFAGEPDEALEWHRAAGFADDRLALLAFDLLRERGDAEGARRLLDRAEPRYRGLGAQGAFDLAQQLEDEGLGDRARVLRGYAQLAWARQHVAQGDPAAGVRSYRQALAGLGAARVRYELAAALVLAGREDEARRELPPPPHPARDLRALPVWAGDALLPLLGGQGEADGGE